MPKTVCGLLSYALAALAPACEDATDALGGGGNGLFPLVLLFKIFSSSIVPICEDHYSQGNVCPFCNMDPLSAGASVAQLLATIGSIAKFINRLHTDVKNASTEVQRACQHVLLLEQEIEGVRAIGCQDVTKGGSPFSLSHGSTAKAVDVAESLLLSIKESFPVTNDPDTLRAKLRWALRDKATVQRLSLKLRETESSLQVILQLEQSRITRSMWSVLLRQSDILSRMEKQQVDRHEEFVATLMDQRDPFARCANIHVSIDETLEATNEAIRLPTKSTTVRSGAFTAGLYLLPCSGETTFSLSLRLSIFAKLYNASFRIDWRSYSLTSTITSRNIIPRDCAMVHACRTGNFRKAQELLLSRQVWPNDMTEDSWPLLDHAIAGGCARTVRMLLDQGSDPNSAYDSSLMTPLQSAAMRGHHEIARELIRAGADIDYVDKDGFSALSYLWVVDEPAKDSTSFLDICMLQSFEAVNSVDDRGWAAIHRAAAIGSAADIDGFIRLGASLDLRTQWYGWTPIFFAASHDNVETFEILLRHSDTKVHEHLDGDGWNLLHCAVYFGAPRIIRSLLSAGMSTAALTAPAAMLEDPELAYLELTARDIAIYIGPERYRMYTDALVDCGLDSTLDSWQDIFWDADEYLAHHFQPVDDTSEPTSSVYGAEDVDDQWTILHWASYCGSEKIKRLLLMKGANPKHQVGITAYLPPSLNDFGMDTSSNYIQGTMCRPFHGPSPAIKEIDDDG